MNTLNFCINSEKPVMFTCRLGDKRFVPDSKSNVSYEIKEFKQTHPVSIVFATNCKSFQFAKICSI